MRPDLGRTSPTQSEGFTTFFETDYSCFDASVGPQLRKLENIIIRRVAERFGKLPDFDVALEHMEKMKTVVFRHVSGVKYEGDFTRLSGEPATSIGNGLINNFVTWTTMGERFGANVWGGIPDYCSYHEGDDGIVALRHGVEFTSQVADECGLSMTIEKHDKLSSVKFCGRFVVGGGSVCRIAEVLRRFHLSDTGCPNTLGVLRAKALSYWATDRRTPVVSALAYVIIRDTVGVKALFEERDLKWKREAMRLTYDAVLSFPEFDTMLLRDEDDVDWLRRAHAQVLRSHLDFSGVVPRLANVMLDLAPTPCEPYFQAMRAVSI